MRYTLSIFALAVPSLLLISNTIMAEALMKMSARNGAVDIEVDMKWNTIVCITTPCPDDELTIRFFDPTTDRLLQHLNYCFSVAPEGSSDPSTQTCRHTHDGVAVHPADIPETGSFDLEVNIEGLGINKPYDTKYSGIALVTVSSEAGPAMQKLTVTVGEEEFDVITSLSNGRVMDIEVDQDFDSIILFIDTSPTEEGQIMVTLPRSLIDAKTDGQDDEFIVLVDGDGVEYEEHSTAGTERTITIPLFAGSGEVEIVGTQVVPEFPIAVAAVMSVLITLAVAATRFRNLTT
jgi:hypothetical protein